MTNRRNFGAVLSGVVGALIALPSLITIGCSSSNELASDFAPNGAASAVPSVAPTGVAPRPRAGAALPVHGQALHDPNVLELAPTGAHLNYYGGRVVSNMQVVQVLYGAGSYIPEVTSTASPSIATFYQGVLNSPYVDWLFEYDTTGLPPPSTNQVIGRGSFLTQVTITPSAANNGATISDSNLKAELSAQIQAGTLPAPTHDAAGNNNTYYAVFFPHGKTITHGSSTSCVQFCAYHNTIADAGGMGEVYYGVHPDLQAGSGCEGGCGAAPTVFGNYTQVASHEMLETITDGEVGLASTTLDPHLAWYDQSFGEVADICNDEHGTIVGGDGVTYDVQTEFSNAENACIVSRSPLTLSPTSVPGGFTSTATLMLSAPAPAGGSVVTLSSSSTVAVVPPTVTIPEGIVTGTFTVTTTTTATTELATISASSGTATQTAVLTVVPVSVVSLTLSPPIVSGGATSTGTLTLSGVAPAGGTVVALSSSSTIATVAPSVTLAEGEQNATFTVSTATTQANVLADITASLNGLNKTAALTVVKVLPLGNAVYDSTLKAPRCNTIGSFCDSGGLIDGRDNMVGGPEQNAPNTLNDSCADGTFGIYHSDESIDRLQISTLDSSNLAPGKAVRIDATVWFWGNPDHLDLYLTTDATAASPTWTLLTTTTITPPPPAGVADVLSFNTTLPATGASSWAIRGTFQDNTSQALCSTGIYDDHDDLVFTVDNTPVNHAPVANAGPDLALTLPAAATLAGTVTDDGLPSPPATVTTTWTKVSGPGTVTFANPSVVATTATFSTAGAYVLRLAGNDGALSSSDDVAVTVSAAPVNQRPVVNAGPDRTVTLPAAASLAGAVTDDGLPNPPAKVTTTWTKVSGVGTVTFANPSVAATTATFSAAGTYMLRLTANDSVLSANDTVVVTVKAAPVNQRPVVNAGADKTITLPATASLAGTVTDDGLPNPPATVTTTWTKVSGPGTVTFTNAAARSTTATFSAAGAYVLRLTASDSALSATDDIAITVNAAASPCAGLCTNPTNFTVSGTFHSGSLGTGAVCYQTTSVVHGGSCTNFVSPRTLKVNGTTETCNNRNWASVPAARNGGYCVQTTTGNQSFASFTSF